MAMKFSRSMGRWQILLVVSAAMVLAPATAPAQHRRGRLESEHRAALALLASEQNQAAYEAFRQLYERTREPRALWRMATAEAALQRWLDAEAHMSLALGSTGDEWVQRERAGLEHTLGEVRSRVGRLVIRCSQPGATITVAGQVVTEFPARVLAGDVVVQVAAAGFVVRNLTVPVPGNTTEPVVREVELVSNTPPPPPPSIPVAAPAPTAIVPAVAAAPLLVHEPTRSGAARALAITGFALGGASVATGVVGLVMRNNAANAFNADLSCWSNNGTAVGGASCTDQLRAVDTWQTVGIVGLASGGVLLAAGAILWATSGTRRETRAPTHVRVFPTPGPGLIGVGVGGAF